MRVVELSGQTDTALPVDERVVRARAWLSDSENTKWLLIMDNYSARTPQDNSDSSNSTDHTQYDLRKLLPQKIQRSILVTCRWPQPKLGKVLQIGAIKNLDDGLQILLRRADQLHPVGSPAEDALYLARRMEGLPLALATAGAYLRHTTISFGEYLEMCEKHWNELRETTEPLP